MAGLTSIYLDRDEVQAELRAPQLLAGVFQPDAAALVHPGKLAWGLKRACERLGVRIFESTPATSLADARTGVRIDTPSGSVVSPAAALATFAHPSLVKRLRKWRVPIYQHILVTEPLTPQQLGSIGWRNRQGFLDLDAFYHYTRLTKENRILWGYSAAMLYPGRGIGVEHEQDASVFATMCREFALFYPQLEGVGFSHRWGGALDIDSRLAPFFGTIADGRVAYAHAYMPGIGASRVGATIMLDLLAGESSPYMRLPLVSGRGFHGRPSLRPYPPEPFLSLGMRLAKRGLRKEIDSGKRGWAARMLNRAGYHF